jgi:hypothetical protein
MFDLSVDSNSTLQECIDEYNNETCDSSSIFPAQGITHQPLPSPGGTELLRRMSADEDKCRVSETIDALGLRLFSLQ